jgi:hypothetical protein
MADFWANRYWNGSYFADRYFGASEGATGPVYLDCAAVLTGSGSIEGQPEIIASPLETVRVPTGTRRRKKRRQEIIEEAIERQRESVTHRPFDPMLLLVDPVVSQNATGGDISRRDLVIDVASAVGEIIEVQPARVSEAASQHAVETINAAVEAFDLDDEEEETLIAMLWANGTLGALMSLH